MAILDAAVEVLNDQPNAKIDDIAKAAGVSRQTVYAHYPSREALVSAAIDHATNEALSAVDAADLVHGPPADALLRFAEAGWQVFERYPLLLSMSGDDPDADQRRHELVLERFEQLIKRGQDAGDFDPELSATWLATIAITMGHAAGEQVSAGRMTNDEATAAVRYSLLKLFSHGGSSQATVSMMNASVNASSRHAS